MPNIEWVDKEVSDLIEYIALYHLHDNGTGPWPAHKNKDFWTKCAEAINQNSDNQRTCK